jgi:hypothetical protein
MITPARWQPKLSVRLSKFKSPPRDDSYRAMVSGVLISTLVMGALLLALVAAIAGEKRWRPVPAASEFRRRVREGAEGDRGPLGGIAHSLATWELLFVLLLVVATGSVLLAANGTAGSVALFGGFVGVLIVGFLVLGVYHFSVERGHSVALATAAAAVTFGTIVLLGITVRLLLA